MEQQWVTMKDAAKKTGLSTSKISRLASSNAISVRESALDRRIKLVDLNEIKELQRTQGIK